MDNTDAQINISINLDKYAAKCEWSLQTRMRDLNVSMNTLESGLADNLGAAYSPQPGITLAFDRPEQPYQTRYNVLASTVRNVVHDVVSFIEELMAIEDLTNDYSNLAIPLPLDQKEVDRIVTDEIVARTLSIARNPKISAPTKLKKYLPKESRSYEMARSYVDLRNCIEHHHGIPKADLQVLVRSIKIPPIGVPLEAVTISLQERTITYTMGKRLDLVYQDVYDIATTCTLGLLHDIRNSALGLQKPQ